MRCLTSRRRARRRSGRGVCPMSWPLVLCVFTKALRGAPTDEQAECRHSCLKEGTNHASDGIGAKGKIDKTVREDEFRYNPG